MQYASLAIGEFAFPGELRDRLVASILAGGKVHAGVQLARLEPRPVGLVGQPSSHMAQPPVSGGPGFTSHPNSPP